MAEKVYGFCENKCKMEVVPKSNMIVLSTNFGEEGYYIQAGQSGSVHFTTKDVDIANNLIVAGITRVLDTPTSEGVTGYGYFGNTFQGDVLINVTFTNKGELTVTFNNKTGASDVTLKGTMRLLLLRC